MRIVLAIIICLIEFSASAQTLQSSSSSGLGIGSTSISGGSANCVLFKTGTGSVGCDSNFTYGGAGNGFTLNNAGGNNLILGSNRLVIDGSGVITISANGSAGTTFSNGPVIVQTQLQIGGSSPSNTGSCAVTSQVGGNTAGTFVASGACAAGTYLFGFTGTAANGWACDAEDRTTITDTVQQQASTTTNATFKATTASADVVSWKCLSY